MSVNNDNFLIEENDIALARKICNDIIDENKRNRSVANVLVAELAKKYFVEEPVDISSGIYNLDSILQNYDISDIYLRDNYIDVRLYFDENSLSVPKKHFELGVLPLAYMFIKVDEDLSSGTVQGFAFPSDINKEAENDDYYFVDEASLSSFYDLQNQLTTPDFVDIPENFNKMIFDYLDGRDVDLSLFLNILTHSTDARETFSSIAKSYSVLKFISINKDENLSNEDIIIDADTENDASNDLELDTELISDDSSTFDTLDEYVTEENAAVELENMEDNLLVDNDLQVIDANDDLLEDNELKEFSGEEIISELELQDNLLDVVSTELSDSDDTSEFVINDFVEVELSEFNSEALEKDDIDKNIAEVDITDLTNNVDKTEASISVLYNDAEEMTMIDTMNELVDAESIENEKQEENVIVQNIVVDEPSEDSADFDNLAAYNYTTEISPGLKVIEEDENLPDATSESVLDEISDFNNQAGVEHTDDSEQIDALFNNENAEENQTDYSENNMTNNMQDITTKKRKSPVVPLLGVLLVIGALGYNLYTKNANNQIIDEAVSKKTELPAEISTELPGIQAEAKKEDVAMPIETVENIPALNPVNKDEAIPVSIPAIEQNLNASVVITNLAVNWEIPTSYASSNTAKRYFMKIGKVLQLNLKTELLLISTPPITNKIEVGLEFNQAQKKFVVKDIITSSGVTAVDELIKRTVRGVLDLNLNMNMSVFNTLQGNPTLVIKL